MKIKHSELQIDEQNPFNSCKLDRKRYALTLTDIVKKYADGFVLAINNDWGTGKTTFVKMWQQHLRNNGFQTVYFNAWENDFDSNPLVAIMSELNTLTNSGNKKIFKSVVEKGAVLAKNVLPSLVKSLVKKYLVDIDDIVIETSENATKGTTEILEKEIELYANKKNTIIELRAELEKFIEKTGSENPLIFIIDELDRCRPSYAVEVLEQMKHFFAVSGIVFILSTDKNHLASSIKGYYGSEQINTDEYLRRFIDLEYSIPAPSNKEFCKYLFDYYAFNDFFASQERIQYNELRGDADLLLKMSEMVFNKMNTTLRQQEKIFGQTRLVLLSFNHNNYIFPHLLFLLVYLKNIKNDLYTKIERNTLTLQELSDSFTELMPNELKSMYSLNLLYLEALLLQFYNNNRDYEDKIDLLIKDNDGVLTTPIKSRLETENSRSTLVGGLEHIKNQWNYQDIKLNYLLSRVNLIEPIII